MSGEHLGKNPADKTISHRELAKAVTDEVLRCSREEGDGIVPPKKVLRLILFNLSPEYAQEVVEQVEEATSDPQ